MDPEGGNPPESESVSPTEASNQYLSSWEGKIATKVAAISKPAAGVALLSFVASMAGGNTEAVIGSGLFAAAAIFASRQMNKEVAAHTNPQSQGK